MAALPAHRRMVRGISRRSGAPALLSLNAEIGGQLEIPFGNADVQADARAPTASNASPTAATPFSITRPARRRPAAGAGGLAPQLTLEAAILPSRRLRRHSQRAARSRSSLYVRLQRRRAAGRAQADRIGRIAPRTNRPTRRSRNSRSFAAVSRAADALLLAGPSDVDDRATAPTTTSRASRNGR